MPDLLPNPPLTRTDPVTDVIHGVTVVDPYRWLEDGNSPETRQWLEQQTGFAREYLDGIDGRDRIQRRIRELLEVTTYDSLLASGDRYVFRKRIATQEQPCICVRNGSDGLDRVLVDPAARAAGNFWAVKPLAISPDGRVLAYEVKEGGERTSRVEFVDVETGELLPEVLPHGYLLGFAFAPDSQSFYYSVEPADQSLIIERKLYHHRLSTTFDKDKAVFAAGNAVNMSIGVISGPASQIILVQRVVDGIVTDCYLRRHDPNAVAKELLVGIDYLFVPQFMGERILALTDLDAPNLRIVELQLNAEGRPDCHEIVRTREWLIQQWSVVGEYIVVCYLEGTSFKVCIFDSSGQEVGRVPVPEHHTTRLIAGCGYTDEFIFECESFFESPSIHRYSIRRKEQTSWAQAAVSLDTASYGVRQVWYESKDGARIPMCLVGRCEVLDRDHNPVILTSYGGFRTSMTPQFSVFVAFLMEHGCLFALPNIRGGGEFGAMWHLAARRHHRQRAFDDFIGAAQWLIEDGIAAAGKIAIFGGSNSGLLVGAALTQAPALFRAVVCMAPLLDMVRYHLFDGAGKWIEEYGTADYPNDFAALWSYSPYHRIQDNTPYPAVMMVSGDADQKCNPLHARKVVARLQGASSSPYPIILDYSRYRGHTPVLPLSVRVQALTDRMAFLCDQLEVGKAMRSSRLCGS
jgi:prolyl oligopeptidase